jgi:hypothetical protein
MVTVLVEQLMKRAAPIVDAPVAALTARDDNGSVRVQLRP